MSVTNQLMTNNPIIALAQANADIAELKCQLSRAQADANRLAEAMRDCVNRGLIYWEPITERGHVAKAGMLKHIAYVLAEHDKATKRDEIRP